MYINSFLFIFIFLPLSVIFFYITKDKYKTIILFLLDMIFFALNSLEYLAPFIIFVIFNTVIGRIIYKLPSDKKARTVLFAAGIVCDVALLALGKLSDNIVIPIGLSFFTFKAVSYLSDIYMKRAEPDPDQFRDLVYLSFFGQLQSGPISRYKDMAYKGRSAALISNGVYRFVIGFSKKVLLADIIGKISKEVFSSDYSVMSLPYAWLGAVCWALELYYDFSGYSDMAIGITNIFGYECDENFIYPYTTDSISKFWRKWHISLGSWFRDYVYIPLGGSRCDKKYRVYFNLFVVWLLTGIWHGTTLSFIVWGLLYFVMISFEKLTGLPEKFHTKAGSILYRIFSLAFITVLWVIFRCDDLPSAFEFISHMFIPTLGNSEMNIRVVYLLKHYWIFLSFAVLFCMPVVSWLDKKAKENKPLSAIRNILAPTLAFAAFIAAVSFMVSGINDPFAYANF